MDVQKLIKDLKNAPDLIPDKYDGSYELMRKIIQEYARLTSLSEITNLDLNAVYGMAIGTWKLSVERKKEYVNKTCLPNKSKQYLSEVLDKIWDNACLGLYAHNTETFIKGNADPEKEYRHPIVGMFGTGFYSFHNATNEQCQRFIQMCVSILDMEDDEEMFNVVEECMNEEINGMAAGSLSVILHCLKPYTFPVINGNYTGQTIFPLLGVKLQDMKNPETYANNCRKKKIS